MVDSLGPPNRPLKGGSATEWTPDQVVLRLYHRDGHSPNGLTRRHYGPLNRFDHHRPGPHGGADVDAERSVLYFADQLGTCGAEMFGDTREAHVCPNWAVVAAYTSEAEWLQVLFGPEVMSLGAHMSLGTGAIERELSQEWARAIYEDNPSGVEVAGVHYQAAHDGGGARALWDRAARIQPKQQDSGVEADLPLRATPPLWRTFLYAMQQRGIVTKAIESANCETCRRNPALP